eukprot:3627613-Pleurochrysis_carterae.AAC.4
MSARRKACVSARVNARVNACMNARVPVLRKMVGIVAAPESASATLNTRQTFRCFAKVSGASAAHVSMRRNF